MQDYPSSNKIYLDLSFESIEQNQGHRLTFYLLKNHSAFNQTLKILIWKNPFK